MQRRERATQTFRRAQQQICAELERCDGSGVFSSESWQRDGGGGGLTRILTQGSVFEQAGVNFSEVSGTLPEEMSATLTGRREPLPFYATGISLVIHPRSPMIPTTHANLRYLEVADRAWYGGGSDLTPYYLFEEDAVHFHRTIRDLCQRYDRTFYPRFKKWCDEYFHLPHRNEARGIGGIFFDYLGRDDAAILDTVEPFVVELAANLPEFYLPIVKRRMGEAWGEHERNFQLMRRGRYVEFNLLFDRGTLFGLKTGGRTESILMSLPPLVRWEYGYRPEPGSREAALYEVITKPREWIDDSDSL